MNRKNSVLLIVVAAFSAVTTFMLVRAFPPDAVYPMDTHLEGEYVEDEAERGPQGGRLLEDGSFAIELVIAETGIPPEFRVYGYSDGEPVSPDLISANVELGRLGGIRDSFTFIPEGDYLRGIGVVREPHSFDVYVNTIHAGRESTWHYESYEGRTTILGRIADESGIETEIAAAQRIVETIELTGTVQANPARVSEVRARFSGIVIDVFKDTGDTVSRGDALALVETNESLRSVRVKAPISGTIVNRSIQVGQVTGTAPLFVIADLSEVWVQLDVFGRDLAAVEPDQQVVISSLDGATYSGTIDWVSPLVAHASQSVRARIPLENPEGALRAGQFVRARVIVAEMEVPLAVRRSALQTYRDFTVVYAKVDETYEVRMLELGRRDEEFVEVLTGLTPGETYVTGNSFLIKADIEKSGASHDH